MRVSCLSPEALSSDPGVDRPVDTAIPVSSNYTALQAVVSIVMALLAPAQRQRATWSQPSAAAAGSISLRKASVASFHLRLSRICSPMPSTMNSEGA